MLAGRTPCDMASSSKARKIIISRLFWNVVMSHRDSGSKGENIYEEVMSPFDMHLRDTIGTRDKRAQAQDWKVKAKGDRSEIRNKSNVE